MKEVNLKKKLAGKRSLLSLGVEKGMNILFKVGIMQKLDRHNEQERDILFSDILDNAYIDETGHFVYDSQLSIQL